MDKRYNFREMMASITEAKKAKLDQHQKKAVEELADDLFENLNEALDLSPSMDDDEMDALLAAGIQHAIKTLKANI